MIEVDPSIEETHVFLICILQMTSCLFTDNHFIHLLVWYTAILTHVIVQSHSYIIIMILMVINTYFNYLLVSTLNGIIVFSRFGQSKGKLHQSPLKLESNLRTAVMRWPPLPAWFSAIVETWTSRWPIMDFKVRHYGFKV